MNTRSLATLSLPGAVLVFHEQVDAAQDKLIIEKWIFARINSFDGLALFLIGIGDIFQGELFAGW